MEPRQLPLPQASQSSQRLPLGTGPHLGHTGGEHPLCFRAWLCAPFLGALGGAGGGHEWAGHWMETRQVSGRCGLLRAGCPPCTGITQSVFATWFQSQVVWSWVLALLPMGIGALSSDHRTCPGSVSDPENLGEAQAV